MKSNCSAVPALRPKTEDRRPKTEDGSFPLM